MCLFLKLFKSFNKNSIFFGSTVVGLIGFLKQDNFFNRQNDPFVGSYYLLSFIRAIYKTLRLNATPNLKFLSVNFFFSLKTLKEKTCIIEFKVKII